MRFFPTLVLLLFFSKSIAQPPGKSQQTGKLYGKVFDSRSRQPVDYATVAVLDARKDSLITGTLVKSNGDFSVDKLPMGSFKIRISFMGYKELVVNASLSPSNYEVDLGNLKLEPDSKMLTEVVVEGDRNLMNVGIDRRTFNVDKDISALGGTAIDAMKNIPGVTVDVEGNVAVRNQSPTIFVDGRPTTLTLEQIPADQIDRIEVITNPSVKYDAATTGGILNIILKKNTLPGYNGTLGLGIGSNDRYNLNSNLNIKEGKFSVTLGYNFNTASNRVKSYTNRTNFLNEKTLGGFNQDDLGTNSRQMNGGRVEVEYAPSVRSSVTLGQDFRAGDRSADENQDFYFFDSLANRVNSGARFQKQQNRWRNYSTRLTYRYNFPRKGKEMVTDITYNRSNVRSQSDFNTANFNPDGILLPQNPELQENSSRGTTETVTWQLDFVSPVSDSSRVEWGFRTNYRFNTAFSDVTFFDYSVNNFVRDSILSINYGIDDYVNAAYVNYSGSKGRFGYSTGLRFEQTNFTVNLLDRDQSFRYLYPDGIDNLYKALFPSLYLSQKVSGNTEFQLNFTRKINRPNFRQVMPFIQFSDRQSYRIGNPNLAPEFFNIAEFVLNQQFKKGSLLSTLYFRHTEDVITNFVSPYLDDSTILISTFINGNNSVSYGWENIVKLNLAKKLDITLSGNIFYTTIDATNSGSNLSNSGISWNTKAVLNYRLPKDISAQINGSYDAPNFIPQGKTREVYFIDFSVNKSIKKKLNLTLSVSDVFNTRIFGGVYDTPNFYQDYTRRRDARFIRFNASWRFGESDVSLFRKRNGQRREGGGEMDMDF